MHKHTYINRQFYNKYSDTMIDAASGGEGAGNDGWNKVNKSVVTTAQIDQTFQIICCFKQYNITNGCPHYINEQQNW